MLLIIWLFVRHVRSTLLYPVVVETCLLLLSRSRNMLTYKCIVMLALDFLRHLIFQVDALLSRYLEYVGGKEDDGNAKIIQDSLQVQ